MEADAGWSISLWSSAALAENVLPRAHWLRGVEEPPNSQLMDGHRCVEPAQIPYVNHWHVHGMAPCPNNPALLQRFLTSTAAWQGSDMQGSSHANLMQTTWHCCRVSSQSLPTSIELSYTELCMHTTALILNLEHDGMQEVARYHTWRWTLEERCIPAAWAPPTPAEGGLMFCMQVVL